MAAYSTCYNCHGLQGAREGAEEYAELPRQHGRGGEFSSLFHARPCASGRRKWFQTAFGNHPDIDKNPCGSRSYALPVPLRQDSRSPRLDSSAPSPGGTGENCIVDWAAGQLSGTISELRALAVRLCSAVRRLLCFYFGEKGTDSRPRKVSRGFLARALGACLALSSKAPFRMMSTADRAACQQCAVFGLFDVSLIREPRLLEAPRMVNSAQQCTIQAHRRHTIGAPQVKFSGYRAGERDSSQCQHPSFQLTGCGRL